MPPIVRKEARATPIAGGVHVHSIIAVKGTGPAEDGNDGSLNTRAPYRGCRIRAGRAVGHSTQATPQTIEESAASSMSTLEFTDGPHGTPGRDGAAIVIAVAAPPGSARAVVRRTAVARLAGRWLGLVLLSLSLAALVRPFLRDSRLRCCRCRRRSLVDVDSAEQYPRLGSDVARTARATFDRNRVTIENIRNFEYDPSPITISLGNADLRSRADSRVDLFLSFWDQPILRTRSSAGVR